MTSRRVHPADVPKLTIGIEEEFQAVCEETVRGVPEVVLS